ncbi:MAG TPA: hypothetical protein VGJ36_09410 [Gemmatimonadales bacterium]
MRRFTLPLLLLALATPGWAQDNCLQQVKFPEVGRWAEYQALYNHKDPYTMRYAVIGGEARGGKGLQWVELRMTGTQKDHNMVYQMLVPGSLMKMDQVQEIVFKAGDKPAMKMNGMMMKMIRNQLEKQSFYGELCKGVSLVGKEKVTVPAGRFEALHFHSAEHGSDSWVSTGVPFSLVKASGKDFEMELAAQGDGAKSSITEQPQEMPGMGGP